MFSIQAGKHISKQCASVGRIPTRPQIQSLLVLKRSNATEKCEELKKPNPTEKCPPPPQKDVRPATPKRDERCPTPPRSRKLLTAAGVAVAGTTLAVILAKHDDDFREWVKENIPALDNLVRVVYKEEETYLEFLNSCFKELTAGLIHLLYNIFHGPKESKTEPKEVFATPSPKPIDKKDLFKAPDSAFTIEDENNNSMVVPANLKHLKELEDKLVEDAQEAMFDYTSAIEALKDGIHFINKLDQLVSNHNRKIWDRFKKRREELKEFLEKFEEDSEKVEKSAENLQLQMDNTPELTLDMKQRAENNIRYTLDTVNRAKEHLNNEKPDQIESKLPFDKVRMARLYFYDQLETFFPNVPLNEEKLNLPKENIPPFVESIVNNIVVAERDLLKLQTIRDAEVNFAIEEAVKEKPEQDTSHVVNEIVKIESEKEYRLKKEELQKAILANQAKCDKDNKDTLKKLAEVYSDLKKEALLVAKREVARKMEQQLEKKLAELRANQLLEMAKIVGRIQGANEAIASRGDKEKDQQVKQQYWSAAQSLLSAVKPIGESKDTKCVMPLKNELLNLQNAAPEDCELVKTVIDSLPTEAKEQGIASEECLKQRFLQVEKAARHVAGLPTGPVSLLQLALARLQSALYVDLPIPQPELDNEPISIEELNNYQLLQRARYYVNYGDLQQAVRYLNLLKGPSGMVASEWVKDVINYLETVQAAELILAHATASK